jgi:hypothetical protein
MEDVQTDFLALTGAKFDDFVSLDIPRTVMGKYTNDTTAPTAYFLYNDPFSGQFDCYVKEENVKAYEQGAKVYKNLRKGEYGYIFESAYRLCEVMKIKCALGVRLRKAYQERNLKELELISVDITTLIKRLKKYISVLRVQWKKDNKPNGLEVQEIRIGGLIERLTGCNQVLNEYLQGKVNKIPELEIELLHEVLASASNTRMQYDGYVLSATVNRL